MNKIELIKFACKKAKIAEIFMFFADFIHKKGLKALTLQPLKSILKCLFS